MLDSIPKIPIQQGALYAKVILPLALPRIFTYSVPIELHEPIKIGLRVEVPLKSKLYSGIVYHLEARDPGHKVRPLNALLDEEPILTEVHLRFWEWISSYYCCTIGEVMGVALPSGLKLYSESKISRHPAASEPSLHQLSNKEFVVLEALSHRKEILVKEIQKLLGQKSVYPLVKKLQDQQWIRIDEELEEKYKPKKEDFVRFTWPNTEDEEKISQAFDLVKKSEKQTNALLSYVQLRGKFDDVSKFLIYKKAGINQSVIKSLVKKQIFMVYSKEVQRLRLTPENTAPNQTLTDKQKGALLHINSQLEENNKLLLHGITGSGKTSIYIEKIREVIEKGLQALYLVPEIALTTQMVERISGKFESETGFYHSRMNMHERVEVWQRVKSGLPVVIGARSSLFLPFEKLGLIIIDEEHDPSYKQQDPNPRYNARDAALYLAGLYKAKVILGTATPSLESLHNARTDKYAFAELTERYGNATLPDISIVDMRLEKQAKTTENHLSLQLRNEIQNRLDKNEQIILFQNRRGYAPTLKCHQCGWHSECPNCDVSLTIHQIFRELRCHYCGYKAPVLNSCPACGNISLAKMGFGTEKVEIALSSMFPGAKVARMDYDTVRSKKSFNRIIYQMETSQIDILVGTQMITKGLDFDQVTLVGILHADALFMFPDFRATEKAFQLLTQVSGRSGRREKKGLVLIQTMHPDHPVIKNVVEGDFPGFAKRELSERKRFFYPPYYRLIYIDIKHKSPKITAKAAIRLSGILRKKLGRRILGPSIPYVSKIRNLHIQQILIKLEKSPSALQKAKKIILAGRETVLKLEGLKTVRINIDVDPL